MLTQERLKENLHYDPETGLFIRLISKADNAKAGDIAGTIANGYIHINVDGKTYKAHRLAWFYMKGRWPTNIDHIDHVRDNNKWINLREASATENNRNMSLSKKNASGVIGVHWHKASNKWMAKIDVDRKRIHIGIFTNKSDAISARKSAEHQYGYHENHGR